MLYLNTNVDPLILIGSELFSKLIHAQSHTGENTLQ